MENRQKRKWYNNGESQVLAVDCPAGFTQGKLSKTSSEMESEPIKEQIAKQPRYNRIDRDAILKRREELAKLREEHRQQIMKRRAEHTVIPGVNSGHDKTSNPMKSQNNIFASFKSSDNNKMRDRFSNLFTNLKNKNTGNK